MKTPLKTYTGRGMFIPVTFWKRKASRIIRIPGQAFQVVYFRQTWFSGKLFSQFCTLALKEDIAFNHIVMLSNLIMNLRFLALSRIEIESE